MIAKNWKKILYVIGAIILGVLLFYKLTWKPNIIEDYNNSGIEVKSDVIDSIKNTTSDITNNAKEYAQETDKDIEEKTGSRSVVGWFIILIGLVFVILIIDMLMQPKDDKKKK